MIKLNLCGTIFEIDKQILCKSEYFSNMFVDSSGDENNIININRAPHIFKHVLAYLIDDNYLYPSKYESELKFFLINYDKLKLYDPNDNLKYNILNKFNRTYEKIDINRECIKSLSEKIENMGPTTNDKICNINKCGNKRYEPKVCYEHKTYCAHKHYDKNLICNGNIYVRDYCYAHMNDESDDNE